MKVVVVGLGVQGKKRTKFLRNELVATVDHLETNADYYDIRQVPLDSYDTVFLCVPDKAKLALIKYCVLNKKHVLVEKPLTTHFSTSLKIIEKLAIKSNIFLYTAYNHRFEPHFESIRKILSDREIGDIYRIRLFYGNGTSKLVSGSPWRDSELGVISDLITHLLDTLIFWFGTQKLRNLSVKSFNFENKSPDHSIINFEFGKYVVELEVSLCMWRNTFNCDIVGSSGSLHVDSLCKWGPTRLIKRERVLPVGVPVEKSKVLKMKDPTWLKEQKFFFGQIALGKKTDLTKDIWIANLLDRIKCEI